MGDGRYRVDGMVFHMPGRWEISIDVRAGRGERAPEPRVHPEVRRWLLVPRPRLAYAAPAVAQAPLQWSDGRGEGDRPAWAVAAARGRAIRPIASPGNGRRIVLGEHLFNEPRAVGRWPPGELRHLPSSRAATGVTARAKAMGRVELDRRTPSLWNVGYAALVRLGRRGRFAVGRSRSGRSSMRARWRASRRASRGLLRDDKALACGYERAFGETARRRRREAAGRCRPRRWRRSRRRWSARARRSTLSAMRCWSGDREAAARYPVAAQRGLKIFIGSELRRPAISARASPMASSAMSACRSSRGRARSTLAGWMVSPSCQQPFNHLGRHNDDPRAPAPCAPGTSQRLHSNFGEFRVPSLRQVGRRPLHARRPSSPRSRTW